MAVVAQTPPSPQYGVVHGWPVMPEGYMLGQATGVGVDSHGHVFVFHRAGRVWSDPFPEAFIAFPTVVMFDGPTGRQLASWGADRFVMPHGLTVDRDDNIWLTDVGLHQVFKFSHDGALRLTLGTAREPGDDPTHFNLPTDVAVRPDGDFYVSDGYANTRVARFGPGGVLRSQWGVKGAAAGQFDLPHGIALDAGGRVYVADRSNARVQVFDGEGRFLSEWKGDDLGRPYAIAIGPDGHAFVIDGGDQPPAMPDRSRALRLTLDGSIESAFGRFGAYDGQFVLGHDIAVSPDGAVYVVDAWGMRVQKFVRSGGTSAVQIDHIILGIDDLERGIAQFEEKTGVRPVFGGAHPGRGTHNALASLGGGTYIEILAPNPAEPREGPMTAGLAGMTSLAPVGWALAATDIGDVKRRAEAGGITTRQVMPGARNLPDGSRLEWVTLGVAAPAHDWAPFFIQWGDPALQPARTAPDGCTLTSVALADPRPEALRALFSAVGFAMTVSQAPEARMTVTLACPKGTATF